MGLEVDSGLIIKPENIENQILIIRGHKVLLDFYLAALYEVETRSLVQAVKRNFERFPADFMFQLTVEEFKTLKMQFIINRDWGGSRVLPYAFTEQGVAMLSGVLKSKKAVQVNIEIMRVFVHLRRMLESNKELARKLDALEKKYDRQFAEVFRAIRELMQPVDRGNRKRIGFVREKELI